MSVKLDFPLDTPEISAEIDGVLVRRTVHPSGFRVLTESVPSARSTSIGFWVPLGSRDEQASGAMQLASLGSTHFLEHLLFKGTDTRNAMDISAGFDRMGADNNAMTAKEYTCYHAKMRAEDLAETVKLLADMVCNSVIDPAEFETERGVILEELAMADDDLSDVAHEAFYQAVLGEHPLGRPIGGTRQTIIDAKRDDVMAYYQATYVPSNLIVVAAGAVDHDDLVAQVASHLAAAGGRWAQDKLALPCARRNTEQAVISGAESRVHITRDSAQTHTVLGCEGITRDDPRRFAAILATQVLGSGMSSRLFQEIREKRGLAYSTYAFGGRHSDSGVFGMYAATAPGAAAEAAQLMRDELGNIAADGITEEEFDRVLGQLRGSSALALEDSGTRMSRLASAEFSNGEYFSLDATIALYEKVTNDDIKDIAKLFTSRPETLVTVGPGA